MERISVRLPVPLERCYHYLSPVSLDPGTLVSVPFGRRRLWGIVWFPEQTAPSVPLKKVYTHHPYLTLSQPFMKFLEEMAKYTLSPLGSILKMVFPSFAYERMLHLDADPALLKHHPILCQQLQGIGGMPAYFWQKSLNITWKTLSQKLQETLFYSVPLSRGTRKTSLKEPILLSTIQRETADLITGESRRPVVLEGVTGSGKTEVALALAQETMKSGKQVLVLLPEIALSHQWKQRYHRYFHKSFDLEEDPLWHSELSPSKRHRIFEALTQEKLPFLIGARSALMLPYPNLGLIIVDEEHDLGYKQQDGVRYHGRDMAVLRAAHEKIPVVLLSATPSLESKANVERGKYLEVSLGSRYGPATLPAFHIVSLKAAPPIKKGAIGPFLQQKLEETLGRKEQSLLFLNRRGYACLWLCWQCQYRAKCNQCHSWLRVHHHPPRLLCHHCRYEAPVPSCCPKCGSLRTQAVGAGIEKAEQEVREWFPEARVAVMSSDTLLDNQTRELLLDDMANGRIDILLGTQLVTKGHDFPRLTCVGIVDSDFSLVDLDFRAPERLFQMLYQVSGRGGRGLLPGNTYLQTWHPEAALYRHMVKGDWRQFSTEELVKRRREGLPPYARMATLTFSNASSYKVEQEVVRFQTNIPYPSPELMGPSPAPLGLLDGIYRWQWILKAPREFPLQQWIRHWLLLHPDIHPAVDIDPYNFL